MEFLTKDWLDKRAKIFTILLCVLPSLLQAKMTTHDDPSKVKASLSHVQKKIQKLEKSIYHSHHQEKTLTEQLAKLEKELGDRAENLRQLQAKLTIHSKTLSKLQEEEKRLAVSSQKHQAALNQLLQATFQHYRKEKLQLLLEQNEWSQLARMNHYYQFFCAARSEELANLQAHLKEVQLLQQHIQEEQQNGQVLAQKIREEQNVLQAKKEKRKNVLAELSKQLAGAQEELTQLQRQEQHLSQLFKTLQEKLAVTPTYISPAQEFAKMKRQLALPVQLTGAKLAPLANAKPNGKKSYISAPLGTPVQAIFPGRVVFAEWLRGIGLLLIVDHGNGYMSLYGNNQKLYKGLGDWVEAGELVARVGQSGGQAEPGLYFEIRKNGEALDPAPWFKEGLG